MAEFAGRTICREYKMIWKDNTDKKGESIVKEHGGTRINGKNRWEEQFDKLLDVIGFRLIKYPDGWGLEDRQEANLGNIESDRFASAMPLIDRLEIYIQDYIVSDIAEDAECHNYGSWAELLEFARQNMAAEDLERYHSDLDMLDMICNHPEEVNLKNCRFYRVGKKKTTRRICKKWIKKSC